METKAEPSKEEEKKEEAPPVSPPKPVKRDFIPDENFSWDLDLTATFGNQQKKAMNNGAFVA